jgi:surfeit locus 1 family protein
MHGRPMSDGTTADGEAGRPTMFEVARRPKWIAALVFALAVAGAFAALGQWQLARSVEGGVVSEVESEVAVPLDTIAAPGGPLTTDALGQIVELEVAFVPGDSVILVDRLVESERAAWVAAHGIVSGGASDGASIAVALGWAEDEDAAAAAIAQLDSSTPSSPTPVTGRLLSSESPQQSDFEAGTRTALSVAELINLWAEAPEAVYGGYVVLDEAPNGLETIPTPPPNREVSLNLLNVFYAIEWVIFAGFAVFLWWRLVRDEWEKEHGVRDAPRPGRSRARATVD